MFEKTPSFSPMVKIKYAPQGVTSGNGKHYLTTGDIIKG